MLAMDRTELLRAAADAEAMAEQASVAVKEPLPVDDGSATQYKTMQSVLKCIKHTINKLCKALCSGIL